MYEPDMKGPSFITELYAETDVNISNGGWRADKCAL